MPHCPNHRCVTPREKNLEFECCRFACICIVVATACTAKSHNPWKARNYLFSIRLYINIDWCKKYYWPRKKPKMKIRNFYQIREFNQLMSTLHYLIALHARVSFWTKKSNLHALIRFLHLSNKYNTYQNYQAGASIIKW